MHYLWSDLTRLHQSERWWLACFMLMVVGSSCYFSWGATDWASWYSITLNWLISPVSAISGVLCVVMVAKGLLSNWIWGLMSTASYGLIAWTSGYYGDWLLNWCYFVPSQFFVWWYWKSQMQSATAQVKMRRMSALAAVWLTIAVLLAIAATALVLLQLDGFLHQVLARSSAIYQHLFQFSGLNWLGPALDASTVVLQLVAQLLMIRFFATQWTFWLLTNLLNILAWSVVLSTDPVTASYAVPTLMMWIAFFINSVYGAVQWQRGTQAA